MSECECPHCDENCCSADTDWYDGEFETHLIPCKCISSNGCLWCSICEKVHEYQDCPKKNEYNTTCLVCEKEIQNSAILFDPKAKSGKKYQKMYHIKCLRQILECYELDLKLHKNKKIES
jgi:hypothetical protein